MNRLFLISIFIFSMSIPCYAQFIGIRIGIPSTFINGVGGSSGNIPNNAMTFNGQYMLFNGQYMTFNGTP